MKIIYKVQTYDGQLFDTKADALKHLDKKYGDILLRLARQVNGLKYTETAEYLDSHLNDFQTLITIKMDMELVEEDE